MRSIDMAHSAIRAKTMECTHLGLTKRKFRIIFETGESRLNRAETSSRDRPYQTCVVDEMMAYVACNFVEVTSLGNLHEITQSRRPSSVAKLT